MQVKKEHEVYIHNFNHQFTGVISSFSMDKNPYIKKATELAKENNIPPYAVKNTKIIIKGNNNVTFKFNWVVEEESPNEDKKKILAYIGELPTEETGCDFLPVFVKINENIYKSYVYNFEEFINDYSIDSNTLKVENEILYINGLNIDWKGRYKEALTGLFEDYDLNVKKGYIKGFLALDKVKEFILEECGESLRDTSPKEVLLDWYEDYLREVDDKY